MSRYIIIGISLLLVFIAGFFIMRTMQEDTIRLPQGGDTTKETIVIQDGQVLGTEKEVDMQEVQVKNEDKGRVEMKEIMVTDGIRHSIPLDEIRGGGPPKDGIPSIDQPTFISPAEANTWVKDTEPGIAFSKGGTHRFYPYQVLVWHELVNDTVEGQRVLISYCPLCLTGVVFDPIVQGERVEFGTSGKLWQSNLVMYDRKTDTLWSQVLGEAIVGDLTGTMLKTLPSDQVLYGKWKEQHPDGEVLSKDTGVVRLYGTSPYGSYFDVQNFSLQMVSKTDARIPNDAFVFGIVENGKAKAYAVESIKEKGEVEDMFEGATFILRHDPDLDVVRMAKRNSDGREERINPLSGFWCSWVAAHPDTELYK